MNNRYSFLAIHPGVKQSEQVAISITDVGTYSDFAERWEALPNNVQAEFGFDLPLHCDDRVVPLIDVHASNVKRLTYCSKVERMTFDEYVALVKRHIS